MDLKSHTNANDWSIVLFFQRKEFDSILEFNLAKDFDLDKPNALTESIKKPIIAFINDIEKFVAELESLEQDALSD